MSIYAWSRSTAATVQHPGGNVNLYAEMQVAFGFTALVLEVSSVTFGAGNNSLLLERALVNGVLRNAQEGAPESDPTNTGASPRATGVQFGELWSGYPVTQASLPGTSALPIRRWGTHGNGVGNLWTFPRGLKAIGGGPSLVVTGGGNISASITFVYEA